MSKYIDADELVKRCRDKASTIDIISKGYMGASVLSVGEIKRIVDSMPAADVEPVRKWQPIKTPPEKQGQYLVMDNCGNIYDCEYFEDYEAFGYEQDRYDPVTLGWVGSEFERRDDIKFWMPLPEPPKMDGGSE